MARLTHQYLGNFPSNHDTDWTDSLQGVAHDEEHWYFTQKTKIFKFHVSTDIRSNASAAVARAQMPATLRRRGGNHFGDPDFIRVGRRGYLFVPVESEDEGQFLFNHPHVAVFRTDERIRFVGSFPLQSQNRREGTNRAGWLAIHPRTQVLHSSTSKIDVDRPVFRYKIDFGALRQNQVRVTPTTPLRLKSPDGRRAIEIPPYLQGGTFSSMGHLYLLNGKLRDNEERGGIRVFDVRGRLIAKSTTARTRRNPFRYQYDSGVLHTQEPEGLTFWDVDSLRAKTPVPIGIGGQLHAILLNKQPGRDNIWFKHYWVGRQ